MMMMFWEDHNDDVHDNDDDDNKRQGKAKVLGLHRLIQRCMWESGGQNPPITNNMSYIMMFSKASFQVIKKQYNLAVHWSARLHQKHIS